MAEQQPRENEMTEYTASLVERTEHVAEQLRSVHEALGGVAVWRACSQWDKLHSAADELERLALRAREVGREANIAAAEYYASKTPDYGEIQYNRLCCLAAAKRPLHSMDHKPIEIIIVNDTTLEADGQYIELSAEEIAFLNRLAVNRSRGATYEQLRAEIPMATGGFRVMEQNEFRAVLAKLTKKLKFIEGDTLLYHVGSGRRMTHRLSPAIQFIDQRVAQSEGVVKDEDAFVDRYMAQPEGADAIIEVSEPQTEQDGSTFVVSPQAETLVRVEELQETEETVVAAQPVEIVPPKQQTGRVGPKLSPRTPTPKPRAYRSEASTAKPSSEVKTRARDRWRSTDEIAQVVGLPRDAVGLFIDDNRSQLERYFKAPQLRARPHPTARGNIMVQCYSPQFSEWVITNLRRIKRRKVRRNAAKPEA